MIEPHDPKFDDYFGSAKSGRSSTGGSSSVDLIVKRWLKELINTMRNKSIPTTIYVTTLNLPKIYLSKLLVFFEF